MRRLMALTAILAVTALGCGDKDEDNEESVDTSTPDTVAQDSGTTDQDSGSPGDDSGTTDQAVSYTHLRAHET